MGKLMTKHEHKWVVDMLDDTYPVICVICGNERKTKMAKYQFTEIEEIERTIMFEAEDDIEADELVEAVRSADELPNVVISDWYKTANNWGHPERMEDN